MGHSDRKLQELPEDDWADARFPGADRDEISLFDLWNVLVRRRWVVAAVTAAVFAAAVGAVALMPATYNFKTAIEIGSFVKATRDGEERRFVEPPAIVEHKLLEAYVPLVRSELAEQAEDGVPRISVTTKDDSAVFVLSSEAVPEEASVLEAIHQRVASLLLDDHHRVTATVLAEQQSRLEAKRSELEHLNSESVREVRIGNLERRHAQARRQLAALDDQFRVQQLDRQAAIGELKGSIATAKNQLETLQARRERLTERRELLKEQVAATREQLDALRQARADALPEAAQGSNAMAVLMVGSEVVATENRLWELERELRLALAAQREDLDQKIAANRIRQSNLQARLSELEAQVTKDKADHERAVGAKRAEVQQLGLEVSKGREDYKLAQARLRQQVRSMEADLEDVRETRTVYVAARSADSNGPGLAVAGALGGVLGLMLGVFAAFFTEFARRAREHRQAP